MNDTDALNLDKAADPIFDIQKMRRALIEAEGTSRYMGFQFLSYLLGMAVIEVTDVISELDVARAQFQDGSSD